METFGQYSQVNLNDILNNTAAAIYSYRLFVDREIEYEYFSPGSEIIFGYSCAEILADRHLLRSRLLWEDWQTKILPAIEDLFAERLVNLEYRFHDQDGNIRWISETITSRKHKKENYWIVTTIATDISDRKQKEIALETLNQNLSNRIEQRTKELHESKEDLLNQTRLLQTVLDSMGDGLVVVDTQGQFLVFNPAAERILGINTKSVSLLEWAATNIVCLPDRVTPYSEEQLFLLMAIEGKSIDDVEIFVLPADRPAGMWLNVTSRPFKDVTGQILGGVLTVRDTTERKNIQEALRQREMEFRTLVENSPDLICRLDRSFYFIYINPTAERIGISIDKLTGKTISQSGFSQEQMTLWQKAIEIVFDTGTEQVIEFNLESRSGLRYYQTRIVPEFDHNGSIVSVLAVARDINALKQAETALKDSEGRFRNIFESAPIGMALIDAKTRKLTKVNRLACELWGYKPEELIEVNLADITHPDDRELDTELLTDLFTGKISSFNREKRYVKKNKEIVWANVTVTVMNDPKDNSLYSLGMIEDISERRRTETALRQSQARFQRLVANVPGIIYQYIFGIDSSIKGIYLSPRCNDIYEIEAEQILQDINTFWSIVLSEDLPILQQAIAASATTQEPLNCEFRILTPSGTLKWLQTIAQAERQADGNVIWDGLTMDISDRKEAETQIKASLKEKEVLLKEIHHRVKNNLYVVASLLELQADSIDKPEIARLFENSRHRVYSMALIHEKLYRSDNLAQINFSDYLEDLATNLFASYNLQEDRIKLQIDAELIFLNIETATPCGLIVNELISNTIKHAFPNDREGIVIVKLNYHYPEQKIKITVADNGVGFPEKLDFRSSNSMGFQVICTLTEQLEGTIELEKNHGTAFHLEFSELHYRKRLSHI